jgi:hypothetical protein
MAPADLLAEMRNDKEWAGNFPASAVVPPGARTVQPLHNPAGGRVREEAERLAQLVRDGNTRVS